MRVAVGERLGDVGVSGDRRMGLASDGKVDLRQPSLEMTKPEMKRQGRQRLAELHRPLASGNNADVEFDRFHSLRRHERDGPPLRRRLRPEQARAVRGDWQIGVGGDGVDRRGGVGPDLQDRAAVLTMMVHVPAAGVAGSVIPLVASAPVTALNTAVTNVAVA